MTEDSNNSRKHWAQSTGEPRPGWPAGVRPISLDGMDALGVGDDGRIYWDGKLIVTERRLTLSSWQKVGGVLTVASAVVVAAEAAQSLVTNLIN